MAPRTEAETGTKERTSKSVTLPAKLYERVAKEADRRDVSVTFLVTRALERLLPTLEGADLDRLFPATPEA